MFASALLVTAFFEAATPGPRMLACIFPGNGGGQDPISVRVEARPSLGDNGDLFRIVMHLDGRRGGLRGLAQPIDRTDARDVLIRARAADELFYTIGLRDDGLAALNLLRLRTGADSASHETRVGSCSGFEGYLDSWLER